MAYYIHFLEVQVRDQSRQVISIHYSGVTRTCRICVWKIVSTAVGDHAKCRSSKRIELFVPERAITNRAVNENERRSIPALFVVKLNPVAEVNFAEGQRVFLRPRRDAGTNGGEED